MAYLLLKAALTGGWVVLVTEMAKRSSFLAALLASLPMTSILVACWIQYESGDSLAVARTIQGIFWMIIPSLVFFVSLPLFLRKGLPFVPAMLLACAITAAVYAGYSVGLKRFGVADRGLPAVGQ